MKTHRLPYLRLRLRLLRLQVLQPLVVGRRDEVPAKRRAAAASRALVGAEDQPTISADDQPTISAHAAP